MTHGALSIRFPVHTKTYGSQFVDNTVINNLSGPTSESSQQRQGGIQANTMQVLNCVEALCPDAAGRKYPPRHHRPVTRIQYIKDVG